MHTFPRLTAGLLAAAAFALPIAALAADPAGETPETEMVVTATRRQQPKQTASAPTTVITAADIAARGATTVAEALAGATGVDLRQQGPVGAIAMPSLRGSDAGQVLVLVDGRRVNNPQTGLADLTDIPTDNVERIEVVRGGASALYGADAVGGVINIITRAPKAGQGTGLSQSYGSFNTRSFGAHDTLVAGKWSYTLSAVSIGATNDFQYFDPTAGMEKGRGHSEYNGWDISGRAAADLGQGRRLALSLQHGDGNKDVPGAITWPSPQATQKDGRTLYDVSYLMPLGPGDLSLRYYRNDLRNHYDDPAGAPASFLHKTTTDTGELLGHERIARHNLTYGYELRSDNVDSTSVGKHSQSTHGLYLQDQFGIGRLQLIPGARLDAVQGLPSELSPKLGAVYALSERWTVRGNVGRSFRAPTFNDRYWPADPFSRGNPNLSPERATTSDLGVSWTPTAKLEVEATGFLNEVSDLILWQPGVFGDPNQWAPTNIGKARIAGVEAGASWKATSRLTARANLTYQDARDTSGAATDGKRLLLRADWLVNGGLSFQAGQVTAGVDLHYTGRRPADAANTTFLPAAMTTDLRLEMPVGKAVTAGLQVANVFDCRYQIQPGYPLPGRSVALRLSERW